MKQKRARRDKKYLKYLERSLKFRRPYQVLVDESFLVEFNKYKHSMSAFKSIMFCEPKFLISECCYKTHRSMPKHDDDFVRHCEVRRCGHSGVSTLECMRSLIGKTNKYHYVVATGQPQFIDGLSTLKHVPVICVLKSRVRFVTRAESKGAKSESCSDEELVSKI